MSESFWHVRSDFLATPPAQVLSEFWQDDELNRQRSLATFKNDLALVDEGLALHIEAIQGAFREREKWKGDVQLRASIAMFIQALNMFLASRHLLAHGYLAEARLLRRNIHESLSQALVFAADKTFAERFYGGKEIRPKKIHARLSKVLADQETTEAEIHSELMVFYKSLSAGAHPTLNSFSLRTAAQERGNPGLAKAVPEDVLMGGLLEDEFGRVAWLALARTIAGGLASVRQVLKEGTGGWDRRYQKYRNGVEQLVREHEAKLNGF